MKSLEPLEPAAQRNTPFLTIRLFGRPALIAGTQPIAIKAPPRAVSLLAYLLVHTAAPLKRDAVAFALWPDDIESDARANLRRHLFYLQNDVLPPPPQGPWIVADKRTICWNAAASAACDAVRFASLADDPATAAEAAALYTGDFLEGFEDEWLQAPRERLRERQVALLIDLVARARTAGDHAAGIAYARQLLTVDPWREDGIRALIELRSAAGDRAGALATYREFVKRLDTEMGVPPMAETTAVYDAVAHARPAVPAAPAGFEAAVDLDDGPKSTLWRAPQSISNADAVRPVPSFTGREAELAELDTALWDRTGQALIHGLGGIGKSALAREFARRHRDRYAAVWWLSAETEAGIIDGLIRLGAAFVPELAQLDDRRSAAEHVIANVLAGLTKPVLLIFDNLDDERFLRTWSPPDCAQVLVTSRHAALGGDVIPVRLDAWKPDETISYLRHEIGRPDVNDADALLLAGRLGFLPLALAHAAAYLKSTVNVTAARYLERVNEHLQRAPRGADYDRAVFATFGAAIVRAEEDAPGAAALLSFAACFAADAIPETLFHQTGDIYAPLIPEISPALGAAAVPRDLRAAIDDALCLEDALGALHRFSLLTFSADTRSYTMHRLVRQAAHLMHGPHGAAWIHSATAAARAVFPPLVFERWPECEALVPHVHTVLAALPAHAHVAPAARLALQCGQYLRGRAAFADAETLLRRGLAIADAGGAAAAPDLLADHIEALAALLRETNRLAEAEPLLQRSIALYESHWGPHHPRVAVALNELAILLHYQNRLTDAETMYRRALAIDERAHGADDSIVALRLHNLALVLHETNRLAEAEPLLRRALAIDERVHGPSHPDVASDLGSLGWLVLETGRIAIAEPLLRRTIAIREAAYGAEHPSYAHALCDVAVLLHDAKRYAEAEALFRRALAIYEASFGADHPVVAACLNNVAELLANERRFADAEALYARALASDEATYGPSHTNVARDCNNFAGLLTALGRRDEARGLLERALTIVRANYEPDHPRVLAVRENVERLSRTNAVDRWRYIRRSPSRGLR